MEAKARDLFDEMLICILGVDIYQLRTFKLVLD